MYIADFYSVQFRSVERLENHLAMLVRSNNGSNLATSDAFVGHSYPHVVARQHDLCQLKGCSSHLNVGHGHGQGHGYGHGHGHLPWDSPACSCSSQSILGQGLCLSPGDSGSLCMTCPDIFPTSKVLFRKSNGHKKANNAKCLL